MPHHFPRHFFQKTLTPFLYPCLQQETASFQFPRITGAGRRLLYPQAQLHSSSISNSSLNLEAEDGSTSTLSPTLSSHLNPKPHDYTQPPFTDRCTVTLHAGGGGHGCVSFLREKYIAHGPPNGGNGGSGGSIWIQAVRGETSLHKLARQAGGIRAGRGANGQGKGKGGERGDDVTITVPVGTVVREVDRWDPRDDEAADIYDPRRIMDEEEMRWRRKKWVVYPGPLHPSDFAEAGPGGLPLEPRVRTSTLAAQEAQAPIRLDLDTPMDRPLLLLAGASGGLGNPHFITKNNSRPKYATKGAAGVRVTLNLELKVLADVGLVGLPNAGKSTLLRAISASRTRVGSWAFTTLQPALGTVVLDAHVGRPRLRATLADGAPRTSFTVADIPGLIADAHLDKGLGLDFLRHIERAGVLAFVVSLAADAAAPPVAALRALWREVGAYEARVAAAVGTQAEARSGLQQLEDLVAGRRAALPPVAPPVSAKPWFVVATKADAEGAQERFEVLREFVEAVQAGREPHPSGRKNAWKAGIRVVPVSAIRGEGVDGIPEIVVELLG